MDIDRRIEDLDLRLRQIELRMLRLEHPQANAPAIPEPYPTASAVDGSVHLPATSEQDPAASIIDLALIGKSILIFGGAFLLRAATESARVPKQAGVAAGLLYSITWIAVAIHAVRDGRRRAAVFYAAAAAIVAYPLVWEATTRFSLISANMAALLMGALSVTLIAAGRRHSIPSFAWIAAAGTTCDALLLAYATKELLPFLLLMTMVGAFAFAVKATVVGWLLSIESDLVALALIVVTLLDQSTDARPAVAAGLLLFAVIGMAVSSHAMMQGATASLIGVAGASALVLSPPGRTILWSIAALVAAEIARRGSSRALTITLTVQSATWGFLAAIGSGLISFAGAALVNRGEALEIPLPAFITAALCLVAFLRERSVVLLAIAVCGATSMAMYAASAPIGNASEGVHALVHTIVLAAASVALASIGRLWRVREAAQLAIVLLVMTGAKVVAQDLRAGTAAIMFITLGVYGSAMMAIARLRGMAATS